MDQATEQQYQAALKKASAALRELMAKVEALEARERARAAEIADKPGRPADAVFSPEQIGSRLQAHARELLTGDGDVEGYRQGMLALEELAFAYTLAAFEKLGWPPRLGATAALADIMAETGVVARYQRLLARMLEILAEEKILQRQGERWHVVATAEGGDVGERVRELLARFPAIEAELTLLERCWSRLVEVLRGEADPLESLFPKGDISLATRIYRDSPLSRVMNSLLQRAVSLFLDSLPGDRALRLLEIGAGTGSTTACVLPLLPIPRTEYVFTDIGPLLLSRAEQAFGDFPFVRYQRLDIEQDPQAQGFELQRYDLVLAANVLHATTDLRRVLGHVRRLLRPGGGLILLEGTVPVRWVDLTFGLTEGWWRFNDHALRPTYPLLSGQAWRSLLETQGFEEVVSVSPEAEGVWARQTMLLARASQSVAPHLTPLPQGPRNGEGSIPAQERPIGAVSEDTYKKTLRRASANIRELLAENEALREREPIAVIGMACRFPGGAHTPEQFWTLLRDGVDAIREVPAERWPAARYYAPAREAPGKMYTARGGFLDSPIDGFDAVFFGIAPREARALDPQHRLLLEVAWEAVEHACLDPARLKNSKTGVFVGMSGDDYALAHRHSGLHERIDAYSIMGTTFSTAAGRLSYTFGLQGPCLALDTACSSSLVGLHLACRSLRSRESDLALAGGVNLILSPELHICFSKLQAISSEGKCKTFDASADGYARGEGCGMVVLKRLKDALRDGNRVLAVVRGSAVNHDGKTNGLTAPSGNAQQAVIRQALQDAGVQPEQLDYVEAHGTGTALGDPIEVEALGAVLGSNRPEPLRLGAVKTNIGHLEPAAGVAGFIKVVLSLMHEEIPPNLHFHRPNPYIPWEAFPLQIPTARLPWKRSTRPRIAGLSSFGFSGTNAHIILEEAPLPEPRASAPHAGPYLLILSARDEQALRDLVSDYLDTLARTEPAELGDLCYSASVGRSHWPHRLSVAGKDTEDMIRKLAAFLAGREAMGLAAGHVEEGSLPAGNSLLTGRGALSAGMDRRPLPEEGSGVPGLRKIVPDREQMYRSLGEMYVRGAPVDWSAVYGDGSYRWVTLPSYPFQRQRFWVPTQVLGADAARQVPSASPIHPLMDRMVRSPLLESILFEARFGVAERPWLTEHLLFGKVVVSGACLISMLLGAVEQAFGQGIAHLSDVVFHQALVIPEGGARLVHLALKLAHGVETSFRLVSLGEGGASEEGTLHVTGTIRVGQPQPGEAPPERSSPQDQWDRLATEIAGTALYDAYRRRQIELGPSHRWLESIRLSAHEAIGRLRLPDIREGVPLSVEGYQAHPGLLDSCFGLLVALAGIEGDATLIPFAMERFTLLRPPRGDRFWAHAQRRALPGSPDKLVGDIGLTDEHGEPIAEIIGLEGRRATADLLLRDGEKDLRHWLYTVEWMEKAREAPQSPQPQGAGSWLLFMDDAGYGPGLAERLQARGDRCVRVAPGSSFERFAEDEYRIDPVAAENMLRLVETVLAGERPCLGVVYLWGLTAQAGDTASAAQVEATIARTCAPLLHLVQALARRAKPDSPGLTLVTRGAQAIGASPQPVQIAQAPLWGLGKTIALEHPEFACTRIDLDPRDTGGQVDFLFQELLGSDREDQVARRGGSRLVARLTRYKPPGQARPFPVREDGNYLICGGLGGLGRSSARELVARGARHLILCGRSPASAEVIQLIEELERLGAEIQVRQADITRSEEVQALIQAASADRPLLGIVHAAGVLDDGVLERLDWTRFARVLAAKTVGLYHLHALSRHLPLDFFMAFSSMVSLLGSPAQGNYVAANAFMDALMCERRARGLAGLSINWGPWAAVGMAARLEGQNRLRMSQQGMIELAPEEAFRCLDLLWPEPPAQVGIMEINWPEFSRQFPRALELPLLETCVRGEDARAGKAPWLERLEQTSVPQRRSVLTALVREEIGRVLGAGDGDHIAPRQRLFDLGIDSLMAVELKNRLSSALACSLPTTLLFDFPTLEALVDHLCQVIPTLAFEVPTAATSEPAPSATDEKERALDQLSQEELAEMLAEKLRAIT